MKFDVLWKSLVAASALALLFAVIVILSSHELIQDISGYKFLKAAVSLMPVTGYVGLFCLLLLENASAPMPGEMFLPLAGYYVFVGSMSYVSILAVSVFASLLGSTAIFVLTRKLGASRIYWVATKLGMSHQTLARNEVRLCGDYGSLLMILSRFIPVYGSTIVLPAGATKTNPMSFVGLSLVGSVGSTVAYLLLGYFMSPMLLSYQQFISTLVIQYIIYSLSAVFASCFAYYVVRMLKQRRSKRIFVRKAAIARSP